MCDERSTVGRKSRIETEKQVASHEVGSIVDPVCFVRRFGNKSVMSFPKIVCRPSGDASGFLNLVKK